MPDWARPTDVVFNHELAERAIEAVGALRFVLAVSWEPQHDAAQAALGAWVGTSAESFGVALRALVRQAGHAQRGLQEIQSALESGVDDARAEQRRINRLQGVWDRQRALEQAAVVVGDSAR